MIKKIGSIFFLGILGLNLLQAQATQDRKIQCDSVFLSDQVSKSLISPRDWISHMQPWISKGTLTQDKFDKELQVFAKTLDDRGFSVIWREWLRGWSWKGYSEQRWMQNLLRKDAREILQDQGIQITDPVYSQWKRRVKISIQFAMSFTFSYMMKAPILFFSEMKGRENFHVQKIPEEFYQKVLDHGLDSVSADLNQRFVGPREYFEFFWNIFSRSYVVAMSAVLMEMTIQAPHMVLMPAEMIVSQVKDVLSPQPQRTLVQEKKDRSEAFEQWKKDFRISEGRDPDPIKDHDEWKRNHEYAFGVDGYSKQNDEVKKENSK